MARTTPKATTWPETAAMVGIGRENRAATTGAEGVEHVVEAAGTGGFRLASNCPSPPDVKAITEEFAMGSCDEGGAITGLGLDFREGNEEGREEGGVQIVLLVVIVG